MNSEDKLLYNLFGSNKEEPTIIKDEFYVEIYDYYYNRGFYPILFFSISEILLIIFSILFFLFFIAFIDWNLLLECKINNCGDILNYYDFKINFIEVLIIVSISIFLIYKLTLFIPKINKLFDTYNYYINTLNIKNDELYSVDWSVILNKMISLNPLHNTFDLTNKIMKKDNYMIALIDKKIIDLPNFVFTKQLEMNLKYIILQEHNNNIESNELKKRFIMYGIVNAISSFFIFLFHIGYFFVSNISDFYSSKNITGPRRYTTLAKIKFREYNELIHYFEERINKSMRYANKYSKQFESPNLEVLGNFTGLIASSFFSFFLIISILDENILLYVTFFDRSLLFYMGITSAISTFTRTLIRSPEESLYDPIGFMEKVIEYTHYEPKHWTNNFNKYEVRNEFFSLFPYKILIFCYDLISIFLTPYYLIFILPEKSQAICEFMKNNTIHIDSMGYMCKSNQQKKLDDKMKNSFMIFNKNHTHNSMLSSSEFSIEKN